MLCVCYDTGPTRPCICEPKPANKEGNGDDKPRQKYTVWGGSWEWCRRPGGASSPPDAIRHQQENTRSLGLPTMPVKMPTKTRCRSGTDCEGGSWLSRSDFDVQWLQYCRHLLRDVASSSRCAPLFSTNQGLVRVTPSSRHERSRTRTYVPYSTVR